MIFDGFILLDFLPIFQKEHKTFLEQLGEKHKVKIKMHNII